MSNSPGFLTLEEEFSMMKSLNHPNFVRWYGILDLHPFLECKAILMDLCDGDCHGLICDYLADIGKGVPGRDVAWPFSGPAEPNRALPRPPQPSLAEPSRALPSPAEPTRARKVTEGHGEAR